MDEDLGGEVGQDHVGVGHDVGEVVETKELVTFCSAAAWESCKTVTENSTKTTADQVEQAKRLGIEVGLDRLKHLH